QEHRPGAVDLDVAVEAEVADPAAALAAEVVLTLDGTPVAEGRVGLWDGKGSVRLTVTNPRLWWPAGMGEQPLYQVEVCLLDAGGQALDCDTKRIGLRTLRLDRHADAWGESFQFVANGVPFFAKGGNWVPADQFPTRLTAERYRDLLASCAAANMNMIRVWGGGIYEPDVFYDLCDELGLCIWQDFMFACSAYPTNQPGFLDDVRAEAIDNVRRIRHHACIALWCGNNEVEQCNVSEEWKAHYMSWADYGRIFDDLLPSVVAELDPQRDYWPSSPHTPGSNRADVNDPTRGDAHLWAVWHRREPFEWYRTCEHRFNSEFGFQAFPEPRTVRGYTLPEDRNVTAPIMEHHQRSRSGNSLILHYMLDWFRLPGRFDDLLWLSQIQQGMAITYAVEHWRRSMPRGMGTLYWQINDTWPVASWSSVDYHGRWKALHHMARRFFAPVLLSAVEDPAAGTVEIHLTSDRLEPGRGQVAWTLTTVAGRRLDEGAFAADIPAGGNRCVHTLQLADRLGEHGPAGLLVWLKLTDGAGDVVSRNLAVFARPKQMNLPDPGIAADVREDAPGAFRVRLTAEAPALWAWLELADADARLSDNFFHLAPDEPREILIEPAEPMTLEALRSRLRVRSLVDTYR
ncbi:MAG: glycoside hydrolase family 2 protein, partial [Planctomycetes bacterium]|nr:glycoside hydrolase family 2 protein [Planctomycetota bacterium]